MAAGIMEANEILLTIDPYWHMFNFVLEHQPRRETNLTIQRTPQLPWIVTKSYSQPGTRAFYHFPHINMWTLPDPYWRLASYKFMHCDYSIILFLMYLERALARYGATVKWLTVKTRPYVLFHRQYERPDADVRHSVFEITARSGNQYIADFTIEQFGYPGYMWFMNKTVYMFQCTLGPWPAQPRQCEVARYRRGDFGRRERYRDWVFREICGMHHFAWWGYEKRERREAWLCSIVFRVWARYAEPAWRFESETNYGVLNAAAMCFTATYAATRQASDGGTQMNLFDRQLQTGDGDTLFRDESLSSSETAYSPRPVG